MILFYVKKFDAKLESMFRKPSTGFTMVELLLVMVVVAILTSAAIPMMLDFRREARIAVARQIIANVRTSYKIKTQQAVMSCGAQASFSQTRLIMGFPIYETFYSKLASNCLSNDITYAETNPVYRVCTKAQVPAAADRRCLDIGPSEYAHAYSATGQDYGPQSAAVPSNPLVNTSNPGVYTTSVLISGYTQAQINSNGGRCGIVDMHRTLYGQAANWWIDSVNGEIFAGTNTPGINECNF